MAKRKSYIPKYSRERQKKRQLKNLFVATIPKKDFEVTLNLGYAYQHVSSVLITLDHLNQIQEFSNAYLQPLKVV